MKISNITLKGKTNPNIFLITTDAGQFVFHSDVIVKYGLSSGVELNEEKLEKYIDESAEIIAFNQSLKYVSSSIKTIKQVRDYLYKKGFASQAVEKTLDKLKEYKIVDDDIYAESYIRSNTTFSAGKVRQKLYLAGVSKDNIENHLKNIDDDFSCELNARKFLKNKDTDKATVEKLMRKLYSQGYKWDTISSTLKKLNAEIDE